MDSTVILTSSVAVTSSGTTRVLFGFNPTCKNKIFQIR
jgi:hypothetical protein